MKLKEPFDQELLNRARRSIAHGALTNSKRPESFVLGVYPTHLKRGQGCFVWDLKGNRYIDFICGLGTNLLGYNHEEINGAIRTQLQDGISLSLGTELEIKCAEKVKEFFPFVDCVRFLKTGSEACSASLRIVRAFSKKMDILSQSYHGWSDEFVSLTPPANGVPFCANIYDWDTTVWRKGAAGVIVEPIVTDSSEKRIEWLRELKAECNGIGALLIFDEIITGFRYPHHSVSNAHGITPDLICLGKALGGGMPLSLVGGSKEIMENVYFVSSTFAGETLSLAASLKFMELLQTKYQIAYLWEKGAQFLTKFNQIWRDGVWLEGYPTRSVFKGEPETVALFMQECCKSGILVGPSFFFNFPHVDIMDQALSLFSDILTRIRLGQVKLEGEMPVKPYAQQTREKA